jgi:hypothetical protein
MKRWMTRTATVAAVALALMPVTARPAAAGDDKVTLNGCLVRGEGDGDPYLLTNTPSQPALNRADRSAVTPGGVGTSGEYSTIFYWLSGDSQLKDHVGHLVEVQGDLKGDVKDGEIEMDRKDNWTDLTVKADGRKMKARVPNASIVPASGKSADVKGPVKVRRVDVEHIKMLAAACQP